MAANWGQAIGGFTDGFMRGYSFMEDAKDRKRRREREDFKYKQEDEEFARKEAIRKAGAETLGQVQDAESIKFEGKGALRPYTEEEARSDYATRVSAIDSVKGMEARAQNRRAKADEQALKLGDINMSTAELNLAAARRQNEVQTKWEATRNQLNERLKMIEQRGDSNGMRGIYALAKENGFNVSINPQGTVVSVLDKDGKASKVFTSVAEGKQALQEAAFNYANNVALTFMSPAEIVNYTQQERSRVQTQQNKERELATQSRTADAAMINAGAHETQAAAMARYYGNLAGAAKNQSPEQQAKVREQRINEYASLFKANNPNMTDAQARLEAAKVVDKAKNVSDPQANEAYKQYLKALAEVGNDPVARAQLADTWGPELAQHGIDIGMSSPQATADALAKVLGKTGTPAGASAPSAPSALPPRPGGSLPPRLGGGPAAIELPQRLGGKSAPTKEPSKSGWNGRTYTPPEKPKAPSRKSEGK